jgi:hypothetical protein
LEGTVVVLAASRHIEFFEAILDASDPFCPGVSVVGAGEGEGELDFVEEFFNKLSCRITGG